MWRRRRSSSDTNDIRQHDFVRGLQLPAVRSVRDLVPFVEERIGKPIRLQPAEVGAAVPCGMWIATSTGCYLFYDPETSPAHQDHIIAHELAHALMGHRGMTTLLAPMAGGLLGLLDPGLIAAVLGPAGGGASILGRTNYSETDEFDAELVGSLLQQHANSYRPPSGSEEADRITRTLLRRGNPERPE
ncbi:hypothetical protein [Streptomyces sp. NPDC046685]|uniref:hypothetical protein n=1 Tax=Streptomyces sp. NPDC046685 TaxID=3157202 RepID=UPI0033F9C118